MEADTITLPAIVPSYVPSAAERPAPPAPRGRRRQPWGPRLAALLAAAACVAAAVWYIPYVARQNSQMFTGIVTSSGVVNLNFQKSGYLVSIPVQVGQAVHKGQMLAAQYAPATQALLAADRAAIASDQARLAQLYAAPTAGQQAAVAAAKAQQAKDTAQLQSDRASAAAAQIQAPSAGTVVAVNGQPGETVTPDGIRIDSASAQAAQPAQGPLFSLLPEGPQADGRPDDAGTGLLPVIALRTTATWHVVALIPENEVSRVRARQQATITVPAAGLSGIRGGIDDILPVPVSTTSGIEYQAVVGVTGHTRTLPLDGMAADVRFGS